MPMTTIRRQGRARRALVFVICVSLVWFREPLDFCEPLAGLYFAIVGKLRCYHRGQMRALLTACVLMTACSTGGQWNPPKQVGAWELGADIRTNASAGNARTHEATYSGPAPIEVRVVEYASQTEAFEAFQKHKVEPGTLPFHKDRLLVVPRAADRTQLEEFTRQFQQQLQ